MAVGADGLMVEVHPDPDTALSDGPQALLPEQFRQLMDVLRQMAPLMGRSLPPPAGAV
jgi:3-deoxy-7-phosphoheptulonate synthase